MYLARYGYMDPAIQNPQSGALISGESVRRAIIDFQAFAGLNQTGIYYYSVLSLPLFRTLLKPEIDGAVCFSKK